MTIEHNYCNLYLLQRLIQMA